MHLPANKVPQHAIQELVGHGSPAMTLIYRHADDQQKADAILALPSDVFSRCILTPEKPDTKKVRRKSKKLSSRAV